MECAILLNAGADQHQLPPTATIVVSHDPHSDEAAKRFGHVSIGQLHLKVWKRKAVLLKEGLHFLGVFRVGFDRLPLVRGRRRFGYLLLLDVLDTCTSYLGIRRILVLGNECLQPGNAGRIFGRVPRRLARTRPLKCYCPRAGARLILKASMTNIAVHFSHYESIIVFYTWNIKLEIAVCRQKTLFLVTDRRNIRPLNHKGVPPLLVLASHAISDRGPLSVE